MLSVKKNVVSLLIICVAVFWLSTRSGCTVICWRRPTVTINDWQQPQKQPSQNQLLVVPSPTNLAPELSAGVGRSASERARALLSANQISRTHKWAQRKLNEIVNKPYNWPVGRGWRAHSRIYIYISLFACIHVVVCTHIF